MSVKKMLNEWRRFINEGEFPEESEFPVHGDHNEDIKEIQSFLIDIEANAGGEEASELLTHLQKPEHARVCKDLATLCREDPEDLATLCRENPEAFASLLALLCREDPKVLKMFMSAVNSKPLGGSQKPSPEYSFHLDSIQ